ncbi:hypothetical protein [Streptomyces nigrescens]
MSGETGMGEDGAQLSSEFFDGGIASNGAVSQSAESMHHQQPGRLAELLGKLAEMEA